MSVETLAEFYSQCGRQVHYVDGTYWYAANRYFLMSVAYHEEIWPSPEAMNKLFSSHKSLIGARFFAPQGAVGHESHVLICTQKGYDLPSLGHKARNQTRQGLRNCEVRQLDWRQLSEAWNLQADTCRRQGRIADFTFSEWIRLCDVAHSLKGFECWGSIVHGQLAAVAIVFNCDPYALILHQYSSSVQLRERPNNALTFVMTKDLIGRDSIQGVSYGPEPLEALDNLEHFKCEMGYERRKARQVVLVNPRWQWISSSMVKGSIVGLAKWTRRGSSLRKAASILNRISTEQTWARESGSSGTNEQSSATEKRNVPQNPCVPVENEGELV